MVLVLLDGEEVWSAYYLIMFHAVILVIALVHRVHTCIAERVVRLRIVKYMKKMLMT